MANLLDYENLNRILVNEFITRIVFLIMLNYRQKWSDQSALSRIPVPLRYHLKYKKNEACIQFRVPKTKNQCLDGLRERSM